MSKEIKEDKISDELKVIRLKTTVTSSYNIKVIPDFTVVCEDDELDTMNKLLEYTHRLHWVQMAFTESTDRERFFFCEEGSDYPVHPQNFIEMVYDNECDKFKICYPGITFNITVTREQYVPPCSGGGLIMTRPNRHKLRLTKIGRSKGHTRQYPSK